MFFCPFFKWQLKSLLATTRVWGGWFRWVRLLHKGVVEHRSLSHQVEDSVWAQGHELARKLRDQDGDITVILLTNKSNIINVGLMELFGSYITVLLLSNKSNIINVELMELFGR